ncbi:MAG: hypothetical protein SGILL_008298, partial [Bacillariaceae sp.]
AAVLVDTSSSAAVEEFLREDVDTVLEQKQGLQVKRMENNNRDMFQSMYHASQSEPCKILWYKSENDVPANLEQASLQTTASESMTLEGLSRDDLREMLLALLPDK